ncbi:DNA-binding protein D-ETS-4-like isoform X2 [Uranotaenia lowii]|nr:DNA-binding protein D-ETS-4-like isoform X2 [Uranotaenia lowii]
MIQQPVVSQQNQSPSYIPATIFHDVPPAAAAQSMKQEKSWNEAAESSLKSALLEQLQSGPQYQYYTNTLLSPPQDQQQFAIFPPSPTPSIPDFQNFVTTIKQEYCSLPPSPPDSNGAPSPIHCSEIKTEFDVEPTIDLDSLLLGTAGAPSKEETSEQQQQQPSALIKQEFQILREHLQQDSLQRRHQLKTLVELESLIGGLTTRADIGSVFELALQDVQDGIQATCNALGISPDPRQWSTGQVQQWLELAMTKYQLMPPVSIAALFPESGDQLVQLPMDEFVRRIPQGGDKLHGHLELWKQIYRSTLIPGIGEVPEAASPEPGIVGAGLDSSSFDTESLNGDLSDGQTDNPPFIEAPFI